MILNSADVIVRKANKVVKQAGTRDPESIAKELGVHIYEAPFTHQKGIYKVIKKNRCIFLKQDLDPVMKSIVLLHEIGHDQLHRQIEKEFKEFSLFETAGNHMEYEANLFAATVALPDQELLDLVYQGYNAAEIASFMNSDFNLVTLKMTDLAQRGGHDRLSIPEHRNDFLK